MRRKCEPIFRVLIALGSPTIHGTRLMKEVSTRLVGISFCQQM